MHDGVDAVEDLIREAPDVSEELGPEPMLRKGGGLEETAREEPGIETPENSVGKQLMKGLDDHGTDVTHVPGEKDLHNANLDGMLQRRPIAEAPGVPAKMPAAVESETRARLLLLDRDGTIIVEKGFPKDPAEVELIPGAASAIRRLRALGLRAAVISNQSGIGRGYLTPEDVARVNARLAELLAAEGAALDGLYYCPHAPEDGCACRKPQRTLLDLAAADLGGDLARSFFVGDKKDDVDAGRNVGATTFLVKTGFGEKQVFPAGEGPDDVVADLAEAAERIEEILKTSAP